MKVENYYGGVMEVFECIEKRRSIRRYEKKDVPNEMIMQIITAGTYAPSAGNMQPWEFVLVRERKIKKKLSDLALKQEHVEEAPLLIVVLANKEKSGLRYGDRGRNLYSIQDTAACIENMLLACTALGLGACWVGSFDEEKVREVLGAPEELRPVAILTVGFPLPYERLPERSRIPFNRITWEERYGKELSWIMDYGRESRFGWKPLDQQIKEIKERIEEKKRTLKKNRKDEKDDFFSRFVKFVKNLAR